MTSTERLRATGGRQKMQTVTPNHAVNFRHFDYARPSYLQPKNNRAWRVAKVAGIVFVAVLIVKFLA
jgi:hypothetical protein